MSSFENFINDQKKAFKKLPKRVRDEINSSLELRKASIVLSLDRCESPIEQLLMIHLIDLELELKSEIRVLGIENEVIFNVQEEVEICGKKYRLDFSIECIIGGERYKFAIECDGHDYHERTKEQALRDKSRDRNLISEGYIVIRFTGSEIWDRPVKCIRELRDIIHNKIGLTAYWEEIIERELGGY
ncbi:endonuclease domain-containing protein [Ornithinibacillus bavariensis]|uniref:endonuclease domain-containing protein n=1 Tax=Ornithinibacillus bavariensis TaxID=545502 RepID=UPI000EEA8153|nr:hypothetical protein [Ornithinibacillus sp.]